MSGAMDLRRPALILVVSLVLGGGLLVGSWQRYHEGAQRLDEWDVSEQQARRYLAAARLERQDYPALQRMWQALSGRGLGEGWDGERQAVWLGSLRQRWPRLEWRFEGLGPSPQRGMLLAGMTLRLDLLHDGDLLGLFELLEQSPAGLFLLRSCSVHREDEAELPLHVECRGDWVVLEPGGGVR